MTHISYCGLQNPFLCPKREYPFENVIRTTLHLIIRDRVTLLRHHNSSVCSISQLSLKSEQNITMTALTEYVPVWATEEMSHLKPELMFLALSLTTFFRKSFSFPSQGPLAVLSLMTSLFLRLHFSPLTISLIALPLVISLAARY